MKNSLIAWTDHTLSPWLGCHKVSEGCRNCYITNTTPLRVRHWNFGQPVIPTATFEQTALAWNRQAAKNPTAPRPKVFMSLCDPLDPQAPMPARIRMFDVMRRTQHLLWLFLTKRPELFHDTASQTITAAGTCGKTETAAWLYAWLDGFPRNNVWLGATMENDQRAKERAPHLAKIPAPAWFISCEPALGPVEWKKVFYHWQPKDWHRIQWIAGGESGKYARTCKLEWIRDGLGACRHRGISAFVKQLGKCATIHDRPLCLLHKAGADPAEWPEDLRVFESPADTHL